MGIFLIRFEVEKATKPSHLLDCQKAFANVWLKADLENTAEQTACKLLNDDGWNVVEHLESWRVEASELDSADAKSYFKEAETEGDCIVYYEWSIDGDDDMSSQ